MPTKITIRHRRPRFSCNGVTRASAALIVRRSFAMAWRWEDPECALRDDDTSDPMGDDRDEIDGAKEPG